MPCGTNAEDHSEQMQQLAARMFRGLKTARNPGTPRSDYPPPCPKATSGPHKTPSGKCVKNWPRLAAKEDPERLRLMQEQVARLARQLQEVARQEESSEQLQGEMQRPAWMKSWPGGPWRNSPRPTRSACRSR